MPLAFTNTRPGLHTSIHCLAMFSLVRARLFVSPPTMH